MLVGYNKDRFFITAREDVLSVSGPMYLTTVVNEETTQLLQCYSCTSLMSQTQLTTSLIIAITNLAQHGREVTEIDGIILGDHLHNEK